MTNDKPVPAGRLTPDQITDEIHRLAREGEGIEKRWAIKMLAPQEAAPGLPPPLSELEASERLKRMLKGLGLGFCQRVFAEAFPADCPSSWAHAKVATQESEERFPTTLKALYESFPEAERDPTTSYPPGYPQRQGQLKQRRWIHDYAAKLLEKRKRRTEALSEPA